MIFRESLHGLQKWNVVSIIGLLMISLLGIVGTCDAQSPELTSQNVPGVAASEVSPAGSSAAIELSPEEREKRKQILSVFWILLIGIAILGGLLLLIAIYLGSRARRIARKGSPAAKLKNEFWYLQKKQSPENEPGLSRQKEDSE